MDWKLPTEKQVRELITQIQTVPFNTKQRIIGFDGHRDLFWLKFFWMDDVRKSLILRGGARIKVWCNTEDYPAPFVIYNIWWLEETGGHKTDNEIKTNAETRTTLIQQAKA